MARNHVSKIKSDNAGVAKGSASAEKKAAEELKHALDPKGQKAAGAISSNVVDGDGSGFNASTVAGDVTRANQAAGLKRQAEEDAKAAQEAEKQAQEPKTGENDTQGDAPAEAGLEITSPKTSQAEGGKDTTKQLAPVDPKQNEETKKENE